MLLLLFWLRWTVPYVFGMEKSLNAGNVAFIEERIGSCSHAVSSLGKGLEKVGKDGFCGDVTAEVLVVK